MPKTSDEVILAVLNGDPLTLAILFIGGTCIGLIWLVSVAIKAAIGSKKR